MTEPAEQPNNEPAVDTAGQRELVLVKRGHRFVFRYEAGQEQQMLENLVRMAQDPAHELDWFDAAVLSHQIGQQMGQQIEGLHQKKKVG